ncbi:MAG TPA: rod shape-determining protein MreD [Flavobacteriaceae bacterium]|nr:rod shape-determining protein MreD [Flavobacteriaceae bacterium]
MGLNNVLIQVFRFIILLAVQILVMSNIKLFGYSSPFIYIIFILGFPLNTNKNLLIFLGFLLGLSMDIYSNTGGVHAGACVLIAYLRPTLLKISFGVSFEHNNIKLTQAEFKQQMVYLASMVFIHHLTLFALENFSIKLFLQTLESTFVTSILSSILIYCIIIIFSRIPNR